jgi:hypothetical protein
MSTLPLTKRNLDPHCRRFLTGNGAAWFKPTNQHATAPAKSSLDPPFRSFDRIGNAYRSSPTIPPAAPTPKAISLTAFKSP